MLVLEAFFWNDSPLPPRSQRAEALQSGGIFPPHPHPTPAYLSVQPYGQDVAGVAVITDLRAFLKVIDVHLPRLCVTDHHHQAAGEEALHDVDVRDFIWEGKQPRLPGFRPRPVGQRPLGPADWAPSISMHLQCPPLPRGKL